MIIDNKDYNRKAIKDINKWKKKMRKKTIGNLSLEERVYILNIFQLTFSSKAHINKAFNNIENWKEYSNNLPLDINEFDWMSFQREYRDYLDLAKLLQLVPIIGAAVGAYVNHKLLNKLSKTAMYTYRMKFEQYKLI